MISTDPAFIRTDTTFPPRSISRPTTKPTTSRYHATLFGRSLTVRDGERTRARNVSGCVRLVGPAGAEDLEVMESPWRPQNLLDTDADNNSGEVSPVAELARDRR